MEWSLWEPWYLWIAGALSLSTSMDYEAARVLDSIIRRRVCKLQDLKKTIENRLALVAGAGPSLEKAVEVLDKLDEGPKTLIAADGACTKLLEIGVTPTIVTTDLDGRIEDIQSCWRRGSYIVVHAHGDNIPSLEENLNMFPHNIIGTTQVKPMGCLHNFGGFTDGDRAVFLSLELGCKAVVMIGMDLSKNVGKYSKPHLTSNVAAWPFKRSKFIVARRLLSWASKLYARPMSRVIVHEYDFGQPIEGVRDLKSTEIDYMLDTLS